MNKKNAAPKQSSTNRKQINNNSRQAQRTRILLALEQAGGAGLSTIEIRENLDVMSPAPRIMELREEGHEILTRTITDQGNTGGLHHCGCYVLIKHAQEVSQ